jgi:hypothetical protein
MYIRASDDDPLAKCQREYVCLSYHYRERISSNVHAQVLTERETIAAVWLVNVMVYT